MKKITDKERAAILLEDGEIIEQGYKDNESVWLVKCFGQFWHITKNKTRWHIEQIRRAEQ